MSVFNPKTLNFAFCTCLNFLSWYFASGLEGREMHDLQTALWYSSLLCRQWLESCLTSFKTCFSAKFPGANRLSNHDDDNNNVKSYWCFEWVHFFHVQCMTTMGNHLMPCFIQDRNIQQQVFFSLFERMHLVTFSRDKVWKDASFFSDIFTVFVVALMLPNPVACPTHVVAPGAIYNCNSTTCVNSIKKLFVSNLPDCN